MSRLASYHGTVLYIMVICIDYMYIYMLRTNLKPPNDFKAICPVLKPSGLYTR